MADLKTMAEELVNLTVKEVNELAEILKEEYGIEPAAAAAVVAGPAAGGGEGGGGEEKSEFDVILKSAGGSKLPSRRASPRTRPKPSRPNSRKLEPKLRSSKITTR